MTGADAELEEHPLPWGSTGLQVQGLTEAPGIWKVGWPDSHQDLARGEGTKHHA